MSAVDEARKLVKAGRAMPEDLFVLFRAIEEMAQGDEDLKAALGDYDDVTINFEVDGTPVKAHMRLRGHAVKFERGHAPDAHVTLGMTPQVAGWLATANMEEVRGAIFTGGIRAARGDLNRSMAMIPIFETVTEKLRG
ncbi:MAG: hypothetical protein HY558_07630 [Euryarchaeota archaeon]|nr:hypothetical protein [Euryarchaeota archaeon]